jgi:hypothetical protein
VQYKEKVVVDALRKKSLIEYLSLAEPEAKRFTYIRTEGG